MTNLAQIDPFLYGYFLDESLEIGERVGLALLHASKNLEIKFSLRLFLLLAFSTRSSIFDTVDSPNSFVTFTLINPL